MNHDSIRLLLCMAEIHLGHATSTPRLDAEVLLAHALGVTRSVLHAWPERQPTLEQAGIYEELLVRRRRGEPVAYLIGKREFWSIELAVTSETLIPRPETELLVELALARIPADRPVDVADLGTGSGAIALALATERPRARIVATDMNPASLEVARENARRLEISNVTFRLDNWNASTIRLSFDMIVCNPPYIALDDPHLNQGDLRFEPRAALVAGRDGLDALRVVIAQATRWLRPGGWLALEHGYNQQRRVISLLTERGYESVEGYRDIAGLARACCARKRRSEPAAH
jgi:release factor glutamine methyltransferase